MRIELKNESEYYLGEMSEGSSRPYTYTISGYFYFGDAESALVVIRTKWKKEENLTEETSSTQVEEVEKQSWSEFC